MGRLAIRNSAGGSVSGHLMRLRSTARLGLALLGGPALAALAAPGAEAASLVTAHGAGYGHGVGMSQYGALGFAQHGFGYRDILGHYYRGTRLGRLDGASEIRVLLQAGVREVRVDGAVRVAGERSLRPETTYRLTATAAGAVALRAPRGLVIARYVAPLRLEAAPGDALRLHGRAGNGVVGGLYRGAMELRPATGGLNAINAADLEDYVRGVVSGESPASWPAEALKAQAIAARTYAIATTKGGAGFDHYPDVRSQVYNGVAGERASTDAAVRATDREVVTYGGRPVVTYFFSTSGGHTEDVEHAFLGSRPQPWLRGVEDPYDSVSPRHRWSERWTLSQARSRLGGLVQGRFVGVKVLRRGTSPRVVAADVVGTAGRTRVTGPQLRARLGLPDSWVTFTTIITDVRPPEPEPANAAPGAKRAPQASALRILAGRVFPARAGRWVVVERRVAGAWRREVETRTGKGGAYRVRVTRPGEFRVRLGRVRGPRVVVRG